MGYRRSRKVYKLTFEDRPGLEVTVRSVTVEELLESMKLASAMTGKPETVMADGKQVRELFGWFAGLVTEWNYEDEDGKPLPATAETLLADDFEFVMRMINAWMGEMTGAAVPTKAPANGADPVEASIPMSPGM